MDSIKRNKIIIATSIIVLVFTIFCLILSNSLINGSLSFQYVHNQNTGEPLSLGTSIFLYILLFWFLGLLPVSAIHLFMFMVYFFLHRKDKRLFERGYNPPYEEEMYFGSRVVFISTYTAIFILLILQISNLVTIRVF